MNNLQFSHVSTIKTTCHQDGTGNHKMITLAPGHTQRENLQNKSELLLSIRLDNGLCPNSMSTTTLFLDLHPKPF
uniref:Uncharacterized protein n=1 Tax=Daphnia magna TaxID=35525 RepID=A0A0N8EPM6_9CRUS